jgi:XapX domain-containing protein
MKSLLGLALAFAIGFACRAFGIPSPAPPIIVGALLVVAMTTGYLLVDRVMGRPARHAIDCGGPAGLAPSATPPITSGSNPSPEEPGLLDRLGVKIWPRTRPSSVLSSTLLEVSSINLFLSNELLRWCRREIELTSSCCSAPGRLPRPAEGRHRSQRPPSVRTLRRKSPCTFADGSGRPGKGWCSGSPAHVSSNSLTRHSCR